MNQKLKKTISKEKLLETLAEEQKILTFGSKDNIE